MKCKVRKSPMANNGLQIEGDQFKMLSPETLEIRGKSHKQGGTDISFAGKTIEAEAGEPLSIDGEGNAVIFGNMKFPGTKRKFKDLAKDIAKEEVIATKQLDKGVELINKKDPYNAFQVLGFNAGNVLADAAIQKKKVTTATKEMLSTVQNMILETADKQGKDPNKIADNMRNGGKILAKNGYNEKVTDSKAYILQAIDAISKREGIDPKIARRIAFQESSYIPTAESPAGALGVFQMMPNTAKKYGVTPEQLKSTDPANIDRSINAGIKHFKELREGYGGDDVLALAAYNGGPGAVNFVKKQLGKDSITGEEWLSFMEDRRKTSPTKDKDAWQNQTYEYAMGITKADDESFYKTRGNEFRKRYYSPVRSIPSFAPDPNEDMSQYAPDSAETSRPSSFEEDLLDAPYRTKSQELSSSSYEQPVATKSIPIGFRNKLGITDFVGELAAITDRADYVPGQSFEPIPYVPYQVSFQDRLNQNNQSFRGVSRQLTNNPEALSILAAQKYSADNQVLAEQFRTNQGITNQVTNQNVELFNNAQMQNLQLRDTQQQRQAGAQAVTDDRRQQALTSIGNKVAQNRSTNNSMALMENMFNFRPDQNLQMQYQGPDASFNTYGGQESLVPVNQYVSKQTTKDATGKVRWTRETDPSAMQKQLQDWELFKRFNQLNK